MEQSKARFEFIDLAKGFCILLVAFFHIVGRIFPDSVNGTLASFRMPLYFILSGMFFSRYGGFKEFVIKKVNRLLIPFLFCWLVRAVICVAYYIRTLMVDASLSFDGAYLLDKLFDSSLGFFMPLWFLPCLFFCGIFFYLIVMLCDCFNRNRVLWLILFSMLVGTIGFILSDNGFDLPLWTGRALVSVPFYAFGYMLRKQTEFLQTTRYNKVYILLAVLLFALTFFTYVGATSLCGGKAAYFFSYYFCGISGTMAILLLSKKIKRIPVISYYGRYSICILMTHFLFVPILYNMGILEYVETLGINVLWFKICFFIVVMLSYLLIIPFMIRFMPHVCAQKDLWTMKQ